MINRLLKFILYFFGLVLVQILILNNVQLSGYINPYVYVLFILIFAVALWVTEAIPPFATGLLIVGLLIFLLSEVGNRQPGDPNYINVHRFVDTWTNSVIWLMLSGFFIAGALINEI